MALYCGPKTDATADVSIVKTKRFFFERLGTLPTRACTTWRAFRAVRLGSFCRRSGC